MKKSSFEDQLKERLSGHEMPVNAELWTQVSKAAGIKTGGGLSGLSWFGLASGVIIIVVIAWSRYSPSQVKVEDKKGETTVQQEIPEKQIAKPTETKTENNLKERFVTENSGYIANEAVFPPNEAPIIIDDIEAPQPQEKIEPIVLQEVKPKVSATAAVQEAVKPTPIIIEIEEPKNFLMPNTITPNNDGVNDFLKLEIEGMLDFSLVVLDAKNMVIYQTQRPDFSWGGQFENGDNVPQGKYQYYFTGRGSDGKWITKYSELYIIR